MMIIFCSFVKSIALFSKDLLFYVNMKIMFCRHMPLFNFNKAYLANFLAQLY